MKKLEKLIDYIINLILPKDAEIIVIEKMSQSDIINSTPKANDIKGTEFKALFLYKDKIMKKAIWAIKYQKNQKLINMFSTLLYEYILEEISDEMAFSNFSNPLLIPIPMHKNNLRERGYNQAELIVNEIYKIDGEKNFSIAPDALTKIKETPHQSKLKNKSERLKNLKNCFWASKEKVAGRNIILIDDVITTGTTMKEASKALREAGAKKILGFSVAH